MSYNNIPFELRTFQQWICWRYEQTEDGKQTKIPVRPIDGFKASVTNPRDWTDFQTAISKAYDNGCGIGFVFTKSDPYVGIDLDNPADDAAIASRHAAMLSDFNTYSELSPSGNGVHIIAKATLSGQGRRRNKVECYDTHRFFTFTGNCFGNTNIEDRQSLVEALYGTLAPEIKITQSQGSDTQTMSDDDVVSHARGAMNGQKFIDLYEGRWQPHYQSQSEADFALVNIIAFYSRHEPQIVRIFRNSALAIRDKSKRADYVQKMVKRSFDKMLPTVTIPLNGHWFDAQEIEPWEPKLSIKNLGVVNDSVWTAFALAPYVPQYVNGHTDDHLADLGEMKFPLPVPPMQIPGLVGQLVEHTWNASIHQVAEAAISSALSTMSLLCSRSYRHGSMGLAIYLLLLAKTSTGKSFAYSANDMRFQGMINRYRAMLPPKNISGKFRADLLENMVMGEIGSAQGLAQQMPKAPSTLAQLDEYVENIRIMAQPNPPPHLAQIRSELLKLMEMSGPGRIYRARKYSNRSGKEETEDVISASFSILATGTPTQFYDELSSTLLTTGFLPRFAILEYDGGLTKRNDNPVIKPDPAMIERLCYLFDKAVNIAPTLVGDPDEFVDVKPRDQAAAKALRDFDNRCYREVDNAHKTGTNMEGMWSRAKDNVRKIASLIAIGVNSDVPFIEADHVRIAIDIVRPSVEKIGSKVGKGEIGFNDDRLEADVKKVIGRMIKEGYESFQGYTGVRKEVIDAGYFQLHLIRNHCMKLAPFKSHKMGSARAFDMTIKGMVDYGMVNVTEVNGQRCVVPVMDFFR